MAVVEMYSKSECHLCDVAKEVVERVRASVPFEFHVIDIEADPELFERYKERVPVVVIDKAFAYQYRVPEEDFRKRLASHRSSS